MRALSFIIKTIIVAALPVLIYGAMFLAGRVLSDLGECVTVAGGMLECANGDAFGDLLTFAYFSIFFVPPFLFLWVVGVLTIGVLRGIWMLLRRKKPEAAQA